MIKYNKTIKLNFRDKYAFLSNFYYAPVVYEGLIYPTVENAFQAAKSLDRDIRKQFLNITPAQAKKLGRRIPLRSDWDQVKVSIMKELIYDKFNNEHLAKLLWYLPFDHDVTIIESNIWHDNYWGKCQCPKCQGKAGRNQLGMILTEVRAYLIYLYIHNECWSIIGRYNKVDDGDLPF